MVDKKRNEKLLKIINFIKKINIEKEFYWHKDSLEPLIELEEKLRFLVSNPRTDLEEHIKADIFRIQQELEKIKKSFEGEALTFTQQEKEAGLLNALILELEHYLSEELQLETSGENPKTNFQDRINVLKKKHNSSSAEELLMIIGGKISVAKKSEKRLLWQERTVVQAYLDFEKSKVPLDFLITSFVGLTKVEELTERQVEKIYGRFLAEPYSAQGTIVRVKSGIPSGKLKSSEDMLIDAFLENAIGICFATSQLLYQTLVYYGFNAYPVLGYGGYGGNKVFNHAGVVVDFEEFYLYLDPGIQLEKPLRFYEDKGSEDTPFETIIIKLVYDQKHTEDNKAPTFQLRIFTTGRGWGKNMPWRYLINKPAEIDEFKNAWATYHENGFKDLKKIKMILTKVVKIKTNGEMLKYNFFLKKSSNEDPFDYELWLRRTFKLKKEGKHKGRDFHYRALMCNVNLSPLSLQNLSGKQLELMKLSGINLERMQEITQWLQSIIREEQKRD